MAFDWLPTLDHYNVPYSLKGKNVSKGNFVVHCPFCGNADQGQHMSVALKGRGWRCFRHPDHRGQHPGRLLAALIGCSLAQAHRIVGDSVFIPVDFLGAVDAALSAPSAAMPNPIRLPPEFREFGEQPSAKPYINYLRSRGFSYDEIMAMPRRYGIRYASRGPYGGRIIFLVRQGREICSWTGRAIGKSNLRYKSLSPDQAKAEQEGLPAALGPISDYLLFHNLLNKTSADTLYLVEGPFDALKVNVLGRDLGAIATCCFTAAPSQMQIAKLYEIFPRFKRKVLLLDNGTIATSLRVASLFSGTGLEIGVLPQDIKDPGDLTHKQFEAIHLG